MINASLDNIYCGEAVVTTMVMFGGYTVCVCNKGWSRLPWDNVSVMVMLWLSVNVLSVEVLHCLYYKIALLDFSLIFSLSAWLVFAIISGLFYNLRYILNFLDFPHIIYHK